ncbi:MAG: peroxidase-related enzyme [Pseudomonadota bacterium]
MTAWIQMISDDAADAPLRDVLDLARTPHGTVDNVMRVHSLRPNTMRGHVILYRACLHDDANTVPMWLQEVIASHVSMLNDCPYSYANHWANARHLIGDDARADAVEAALQARALETVFEGKDLAALRYAGKLTEAPGAMEEADVVSLRGAGWADGEILEINQIVGYFNYVNRLLNGLGVSTAGDVVGYYASADEDDPGSPSADAAI